METYTVTAASPKGHLKQLTLKTGDKKAIFFLVPRFAAVGKGDQVRLRSRGGNHLHVLSSEDSTDSIAVTPHFERRFHVSIGGKRISGLIVEMHRPGQDGDLNYLEQFHYKTYDFSETASEKGTEVTSTGGRRGILLLYLKTAEDWQAVGYIELQMPLMMCKPRHDLFDHGFNHPTRTITWARWDQHAIKRYVNTIVRIARVVVSPEYRGLGLAHNLVDASKEYCRERWQIGGRRPLFLEISAEMLKYVDFVSACGFRFVANTEGNLERVVKDMQSMDRGYAANSGIMTLQKRYLTTIRKYCDETNKSFDDVIRRLKAITAADDPAAAFSPTEWVAFRSVLRLPIPYFLFGLDEHAEAFLRSHVAVSSSRNRIHRFVSKPAQIDIKNLRVTSEIRLPLTKNVRLIMDAFGLRGDVVTTELVPSISISASSGNIVLIAGTSGSGKSVLLRTLDPGLSSSPTIKVSGTQQGNYTAAWLRRLPDDTPIFDYFAELYGPERSFAALSQAGLSEAFALIKPFSILSRGQQYRAMMADLLLRDQQVWLLDEFCADLDPLTAKIVAHNFRKHVMSAGRIALVAAANNGHFVDALRPTRVIVLRPGRQANVLSYRDYRDELLSSSV